MYSGEPAQERRQLWLWPNLLSLDAPLLAVLWLNLFAVSAQIAVTPTATLTLALVVWAIYIADRLLDSLRHDESSAARHQFCRQHRAAFAVTLALLLAAIGWLLDDLEAHTLRAGLVMIAVVAAYFAAVHFWRWALLPKEIVVALLFAAGASLPLWADSESHNVRLMFFVVLFAALCWMNAALIEYSEWIRLRFERGKAPHASTIAAGKHLAVIGVVVALLTGGLALVSGFVYAHAELPLLSAVALSALALAWLGWSWRRLGIDQVRVLADASLLTPAVILLLMWR